MNIQKRLKMNLEQALLTYGNDISNIILRDGTNIEIIDDNDFIEEKFEDNYYNNYDNYIYKEINQEGTLRGKGLKQNYGKALRKTVLKSSLNPQEKLRSNNYNNKNGNNIIIKHSENNEYLQCANCFKFFNSKESEEEIPNTNNIPINNNINQNHQNIPRQIMPPQPPHQKYNQNNIPNPNQNQSQYQRIPVKYPQNPPQIPRGPNQRTNMPPPPQYQYYNNNNIPKGNMKMPYYNNNINQGNQIFRARKRNSGKYQQKENKSELIQKNYVGNKYPGSAKKMHQEINYDFEGQETGYIDNNLGNYFNENKYYDYPPNKFNNNYFGHSSNKRKENNYYQPEVGEFQENEYYQY